MQNESNVLAEKKPGKDAKVCMKAILTPVSGVSRMIFSGDSGCSKRIFTDTRKADGKKAKVRGCDIYIFKDGKISLKNSMRKQEP